MKMYQNLFSKFRIDNSNWYEYQETETAETEAGESSPVPRGDPTTQFRWTDKYGPTLFRMFPRFQKGMMEILNR